MEPISVAIGTFIVFGLGVIAGWFAVRERGPAMYARAKAEAAGDLQALTERLASRDLQLSEIRGVVEARDRDLMRVQSELKIESERRITLEGKASRLPSLDAEVEEWERRHSGLQAELSELRSHGVEHLAKGDEARRMLESRNSLFEELRTKYAEREAQVVQAQEDLGNFRAAAAELAAKFDQRQALLDERQSGLEAARTELTARDKRIAEMYDQVSELKAHNGELTARIEETRRGADERLSAYGDAQERLSAAFKGMCADALRENNQSFLQLATLSLSQLQEGARGELDVRQRSIDESLKPLRDSLEKVDSRIVDLEKERIGAYAGLSQQVESLARTQTQLSTETAKLVNALGRPAARGVWGEMQLRRVVELAGMVEYCDFTEQKAFEGEAGRLRPDVTIHLPNDRVIVVDAKAPLSAYLEALEASDETVRAEKLKLHSRQVRDHLKKLGEKSYWEPLGSAPEFVIAFLPGETFFQAALEQDASLIEFGVEQKVLLTTPTTLIALLKAVAYGWRQEKVSANAREIRDLGKTLYERLRMLAEHFEETRKHLERTNASFNRGVGTFENRVLVTARRFKELGASPEADIPVVSPVEALPRALQGDFAPESVVEPVLETAAETVAEPVAETIPEPIAERLVETLAEPLAQPIAESVAAPEPEAVAKVDEPVAESVPELEVIEPAPVAASESQSTGHLAALEAAVAHESLVTEIRQEPQPEVAVEQLTLLVDTADEPEFTAESEFTTESEFLECEFVQSEFVESEYVDAVFVTESADTIQAAVIAEEASVVEEAHIVEQAQVVSRNNPATNLLGLARQVGEAQGRRRTKAERSPAARV